MFVQVREVAKVLALLLQKEKNRALIYNKIKESKYVENILECSEFMQKKEIKSLLSKTNNNDLIEKLNKIKFGDIDIYFPKKEWREDLNISDPIYVAAVAYRDENERNDILAYDLKGNEIFLSPNISPSVPTLVVYPSEKHKNYLQKKFLKNSSIQKFNSISGNRYQEICEKYKIEYNHEGWFGGAMEIYFKIWYKEVGSNFWSSEIVVNMDQNTQVNTWTTVNTSILTMSNNFYYKFEIWEDDGIGQGSDDFVGGPNWSMGTELPCSPTPYSLIYTWFDGTTQRNYDVNVDMKGDYPEPLTVSISGPLVLQGTSVQTNSKINNIIAAPSESATGTWTVNVAGGVGFYTYQWYYKYPNSNYWISIPTATSKNYTRTIFNDIDLKCEVESGDYSNYNTVSIDYVPAQ